MPYRSILAGILILVALTSSAAEQTAVEGTAMKSEPAPTGFLNKTMMVNGQLRKYVLYVPHEYTPEKPWPLIVFLHGMGERGEDGLAQSQVGIGRAIRMHADRFPCLVVMPQCPGDVTWAKATKDIDISISDTLKTYAVDQKRIYLTGISMGGYATWQYGAAHTDLFAAMMPICGGGKLQDAERLAQVPIWAFHGEKDSVVPPRESRQMVEAIKKAGGRVKYTEFEDTDHNSWDPAYDEAKAIKWLLKHHKK